MHTRLLARTFSAALLATAVCPFVRAADANADSSVLVAKILDPGTRKAEPAIAEASNEGEQAISRMKLPAGYKISLWAAEPMLANPVAFNIDEKGRVFVAETYRYRSSELDIRDYMRLLEDELANRNLGDFEAMIKRRFDADSVKELGVEGEILRLVEDRDHDGVADHSAVYADGFNTILDGIASGVMARRGQVWFTNIPSLWKFTGVEKAETRTEISRGYGIRYNFTGHDLHGLTFGPDGKIYFSVGDRAAHAVAIDGSVADTPDTGSVFRSNPDGTQLEIFATGLRNPQSLAFTENGDLFTGDNDSDQTDEERFVHVVENGDSGWRIGYQYSPLGKGGPWISEKLFLPRDGKQPAYLLSPIANVEDGPSGLAYYPGTGLNPDFAGTFFLSHFTGSIARAGVFTYKVAARGASYKPTESTLFLTSALPTDVKFAPDGRLYISDWNDGWRQSKKGRIYAISDPAHANDPLIKETEQLIGGDWVARSSGDLTRLLGHADWRVRLEAQFTLAERGSASIPIFASVATNASATPLARRHAIWGLGQLAVKDPAAVAPLRTLLRDSDAEVRAQTAKMLGDHGAADMGAGLISALTDESNRVKFFAAQSLGKLKTPNATPALLAALRANDDKDEYLRHALVMGLVGGGPSAALDAAVTDSSRAVRLGVLLAYRRLGRPEVERFLTDRDPYIVREAAEAINDAPIMSGYAALAALLDKSAGDEPIALRAINAHFRLGQPANAAALAKFAARSSVPAALRVEAITQLGNWATPPARDRIVGIYRPLAEKTRDAGPVREALTPVVASLLSTSTAPEIQSATISAVEKLQLSGAADALFAALRNEKLSAANRVSALKTLDALKDPRLPEAISIATASKDTPFRLAAMPMVARIDPVKASAALESVFTSGTVRDQALALDLLQGIDHSSADAVILKQLKLLEAGKVPPETQLDVLEAAAKRSDPEIKRILEARKATLAADKNPLAEYAVVLNGGDRARGSTIFQTQPSLACVRCHRSGPESGSEVGPNLADVGARLTREQILESIVKPNAKFAAGFENVVLTLTGSRTVSGVVTAETSTSITVRPAQGAPITVTKTEVTNRTTGSSAMPEVYATLLTKKELRDVVEYLSTLRPFTRGNRAAAPASASPPPATPATTPAPRVLRFLRNVPPTPAAKK